MKKTKRRTKYLLLLLILFISVGYAILQSNLTITGTTSIQDSKWDIHWNNVVITEGSVSTSNADKATIDNTKTTVNYNITLNKPGDFYEFTVDAVNEGTIDGMIDVISSKLNNVEITTLPAYLNYSITYSDGTPLQKNQELKANSSETYKVRIEYKRDIEANQLPETTQTLNLSFSVTYKQANENAQEVEHAVIKYTVNLYDDNVTGNNIIWIGQAIPNSITQYSSASEALAAFRTATGDNNIQFYLKHTIQGGVVTESYVEFVVTQAMASSNSGMTAGTYALRGLDTYDENASSTKYCRAEYYNSTTDECISPYYESNKETLLTAFGSSYCIDHSFSIDCGVSGLYADVRMDGRVYAYDDNWDCGVYVDGSSYCE